MPYCEAWKYVTPGVRINVHHHVTCKEIKFQLRIRKRLKRNVSLFRSSNVNVIHACCNKVSYALSEDTYLF